MNNDVPDRIAEIFIGKTIFITGGTGLVGKALIEKLLRYSDIKKLYLLIRDKKGKTPNERIKDLFNDVLFKKLLLLKPNEIKKCVLIPGDVTSIDLGISEENRAMLTEEVDFIIHSAATVRFDDSIKYAVTMNTRGTKFALELAEQCKNLTLFIHVSTAYAFPNEGDITLEKEYPAPGNPHEIINSLNWLKDEAFTPELTKRMLGDIPNTYTFSKALSEALVYEKVGKIPVIICRPAIIVPAFKDPLPGWTNNLQGPAGLFVGAGKGVVRSVYMDGSAYANFAPIDSTVSAILIFAWHYLTSNDSKYIFNVCMPSSDLQLQWGELLDTAKDVVRNNVPFNRVLWYPGGGPTTNRIYNNFITFFFQIIPALLIDLILIIVGQKPALFSIQMRIRKGTQMYEYYTNRAWNFETTSIESVRQKLTSKELEHYQLKEDVINIREYIANCILFCRKRFLNESDDTLPTARITMKFMYVLDKVAKAVFFLMIGYYFYKIFLTRLLV